MIFRWKRKSEPERYIKAAENRGDIMLGMTNLPSHFQMGLEHIRGFKNIRLALGLHPQLVSSNMSHELTLFEELVDKTSYIGEIGLDFSGSSQSHKEQQVYCLMRILDILKGKNKIISVHSRRAEKKLLQLLTEYEIHNVIFHWYSGPLNLIDSILERGYYFSINEAMTLSPNGRKIINAIPKDRLLLESDAPFNKKCSLIKAQEQIGISDHDLYLNFKDLVSQINNQNLSQIAKKSPK